MQKHPQEIRKEITMSQPILRWAGSKRKLLPLLQSALPKKFSRYIEPFAGSAVLFLKLNPKIAIINDLNDELVRTYKAIQRCPKAVWERAHIMSQDVDFYYELRAIDPQTLHSLDRAARFIYLNRFCFNGVYRTNLSGKFNVPRGSGNLYIPELDVFKSFSSRLKTVDLHCLDFQNIVDQGKKGDFIYLDPPYALGEKKSYGEYGCDTFKEKDEDRLIESLKAASSRGAKILLSYSPSDLIASKLVGWKRHDLTVTRSVAGFIGARRKAEEMLVSNYEW